MPEPNQDLIPEAHNNDLEQPEVLPQRLPTSIRRKSTAQKEEQYPFPTRISPRKKPFEGYRY